MRWHMAEDDDIIIVSVSDSSDVEIITSSSDEDCFVPSNGGDRAGNPQTGQPSLSPDHLKNHESLQSSYRHNQHGKHSKHSESDHVIKDERRESDPKMTCETSQALWQEKKKSHKSWSQIKNEREKQKHLPPACKRAKLNLPEPICSNKLCRTIDMSDNDDLSDDLPDLVTCRTTPELRTGMPSSPITLSSDDEASTRRPGIFASFEPGSKKSGDDGTKDRLSQCKENSATINRTKLLLTQSAKEKMALIFNKVLKQKSVSDVRPQSPSGFSDISSGSSGISRQSSSTSSRHFLDAITPNADNRSCSSPVPSVPDGSVTSLLNADNDDDNEDDDDDDDDDDEEEEHSDEETVESHNVDDAPSTPVKASKTSFLSTFNQSPEVSRPKKARLNNVKSAVNSLPMLDMRRHFPIVNIHPWERLSPEGRASRHVSYDSKFVHVDEDLVLATAALTHLHVNTVDAVFEEGDNFLDYGLSLVSDFSSYLKPTESIIKEIVNKCLLGRSSRMYVSYKSFKLLSYLWQKYPSSVHIDWEVFAQVLGDLAMEKGLQVVPSASVVKGSLFLQVIVQALQMDLYGRNLHSLADARRTLCYKLLSVDHAYSNLKQIIYWLGSVIASEYAEVRLANHVPPPMVQGQGDESKWFLAGSGSVPKVLPNLQKLLHLGIQVSRSCVGAAKRVSAELVQTYIYLPDLRRKKLLLQSMSSDLLRFKVTQKILEDHCDGTSLCCEDFPASLRQVVDAYYLASPPRSLVTPPQSPSDDENLDPGVTSQQFSAVSCEELAFLVYTNTQSYIRCAHDTEHEPVSQNGFQSRDFSFLSDKDQQRLRKSVDEFRDHLCRLTAELNSATLTYVFMMQCLGNLH